MSKFIGIVSAYAYAVSQGYTGTEEEYAELMASYATVAEQASQSAQTASEKAQQASQSAQTASEKAQQASASATSASQSADTASASATSAQASAQTASAKASEAQQSATTATTKAQEASQSASESSQSASTAVQAKEDAQTAKTASETAQGIAESARDDAESARDTASQSAQTATEKAQQASASATSASQSADTASASAQTAQTAQQTASTKASEAQQSATTATTKAQEASQSASESSQSASTAVQAKEDAQTAKTASETAQGIAESARDDAESARDLAQQYAESIDPENIFSAYPTDTASGAVATFPDGADDIPMKSCVVHIEPVQSGSGDPSPDNVRPISGWTGAVVSHSGSDMTNPTTYPITFPSEAGTVYGGVLDVTTGVLTADLAMVDLGTLVWNIDGNRFKASVADMPNKAGRTIKMLCDCYKSLMNGEVYDQNANNICYGAYSGVYVHDFAYTDASIFKTAVTGHQLVYELATPITYQLTPTEIRSLLGTNNIWADTGDSEVEYRANTKLYIQKKITEAVSALT